MHSIHHIVIIGSGNVATALAEILVQKGMSILQVYSPNDAHARALASVTGCIAVHSLVDISQEADLYIIAIKDDAISEINARLRLPGKMVVHTSGSVSLAGISSISARTGVFYPLQTFSKTRQVAWPGVPICIEASETDMMDPLLALARKLTNVVFEINSAQRRHIHLAAVFANNFINYLLGLSKGIMEGDMPFEILKPLVQETVEKAFAVGPEHAQTGPAARKDDKTIEAHLALLHNKPEARQLYALITQMIMNSKI